MQIYIFSWLPLVATPEDHCSQNKKQSWQNDGSIQHPEILRSRDPSNMDFNDKFFYQDSDITCKPSTWTAADPWTGVIFPHARWNISMQCNQRRSTKGCHVTNTVTRNQQVWKYQTIELSPLSKVISKNLSKTKRKTTNCNGQKRLGRNYVVPSSYPSSTLKTDSLSFFSFTCWLIRRSSHRVSSRHSMVCINIWTNTRNTE